MKRSFSVLVMILVGIMSNNTVVQSELSCDGHDIRAMMVQLQTLRQEFADYKHQSEKVIQGQNKDLNKYRKLVDVLNDTIHEKHAKYERAIRVINYTVKETIANHTRYENAFQGLNDIVQGMNETIKETLQYYSKSDQVIQELRNNIEGLNDTVQGLNATIQETLTNQTKSDMTLQDQNRAVQETLKNHTAELLTLKDLSSDKLVGFIATTRGMLDCNGVINFETTVTNNGSAYNSSNGYFTAPYMGIYMFSVQLCFYSPNGDTAHFNVSSPNQNQYFSWTKYSVENYDFCKSVTTTAYLSKYDQVYVNCTHSPFGIIRVNSYNNEYRNLFTGVLINAAAGQKS